MSENKPKRNKFKALCIIETLIIAALSGGLIWNSFLKDKFDENGKAVPVNGGSASEVRTRPVIEKEETFYQLDGKKILMQNSVYGEVFMPVFADVPACSLDMNSLVTRNGYAFYKENEEITSIAGIDVSEHQGDIDWNAVKNAGIEFAIIRVGYRTYGGGEITLDTTFEQNLRNADAAGIKTGVYFFSQAIDPEEAIEEADAVIDAIRPYNITYPVIFDWELITGDSARTDAMTVDNLADACISFCERVKSAGYTPMIYQNKNTTMFKLDLPKLQDYDFWLAEYGDKPTYYYDYQMWQYSSTGKVPGINGEVDMNISFKDYSTAEN
ncbi:MAG: glycoside hydrolase family 25 protein [Ruminococcus flavefaciens]|nr:glycoside hydrolase family 25 protein [Ruminococcus flavefaciens]MCM1360572.1 glycoside hydrolase family 25 protein [Clostridiales bacterium]MCM1435244.1 glycoside hydrolase family 25 protein [Ruminococcus flavefaciens]